MDEQGVRKAILMDNLAKPSVTARKFVEASRIGSRWRWAG